MTSRLTSRLRRRTAATTLATLGVGVLLTATATTTWASPSATSPSPSITRQQLCDRAPEIEKHLASLLARIQGGSDVTGSAAWLQARADSARAAGRTAAADRLEDRSHRRLARVESLQRVQARVQHAQETVCAANGSAS